MSTCGMVDLLAWFVGICMGTSWGEHLLYFNMSSAKQRSPEPIERDVYIYRLAYSLSEKTLLTGTLFTWVDLAKRQNLQVEQNPPDC